MSHIILSIQFPCTAPWCNADQWKILQILQAMCFRCNIRIFRTADENLAEGIQGNSLKRFLQCNGSGDYCEVYQAVFQCLNCLWCGMIGDSQLHMWIMMMEYLQLI